MRDTPTRVLLRLPSVRGKGSICLTQAWTPTQSSKTAFLTCPVIFTFTPINWPSPKLA